MADVVPALGHKISPLRCTVGQKDAMVRKGQRPDVAKHLKRVISGHRDDKGGQASLDKALHVQKYACYHASHACTCLSAVVQHNSAGACSQV